MAHDSRAPPVLNAAKIAEAMFHAETQARIVAQRSYGGLDREACSSNALNCCPGRPLFMDSSQKGKSWLHERCD